MRSIIFEITGRQEIGLELERLVDEPVLKTGTVREIFNLTGNTPVSKERFIT